MTRGASLWMGGLIESKIVATTLGHNAIQDTLETWLARQTGMQGDEVGKGGWLFCIAKHIHKML